MKKYGLPYQGSKSRLAERIVALLPQADNLYDLFAGGCAVSHCAIMSGKWKKVFINDITDSVVLFDNVMHGNIPDGSEWISREEFYKRKDNDPWVRILWSFSNNQKNYLYSADIEPYKKAVHEMIYAPTPNERRLKFRQVCKMMPQILDNQAWGGYSQGNRPRSNGASTSSITDWSLKNAPERLYRLQSAEYLPPPHENSTICKVGKHNKGLMQSLPFV